MEFAPAHRARRIRELLEVPGRTPHGGRHAGHPLGHPARLAARVPGPAGNARCQAVAACRRPAPLPHPRMGRPHARGRGRAGAFAAWRSALVRRIAPHPALKPLAGAHGYSPLFGPWLAVASRVGFAVETLLLRGTEPGIDPAVEAATALAEAAAVPAESWGGRPRAPRARAPRPAAARIPATALSATPAACSPPRACPASTTAASAARWPATSGTSRTAPMPLGCPVRRGRQPWKPPFSDQLPLWAAGGLVPVITDWNLLVKDPLLATEPPSEKDPMNTTPATAQDFSLRTTVYVEELGAWGTEVVPAVPGGRRGPDPRLGAGSGAVLGHDGVLPGRSPGGLPVPGLASTPTTPS